MNLEKSAVAHPWERKFLGYSMTHHFKPRLKVAGLSVKRYREKLKAAFHRGRGRKLERFIEQELNPILRGLGKLLPVGRSRGDVRRTGPVGEKKASPDAVAAMETQSYSGCPPDTQRAPQGARYEVSRQWPRVLVELGSVAHERGVSQEIL